MMADIYVIFVLVLWILTIPAMWSKKYAHRMCIETYKDLAGTMIIAIVPILNLAIFGSILFCRDKIWSEYE